MQNHRKRTIEGVGELERNPFDLVLHAIDLAKEVMREDLDRAPTHAKSVTTRVVDQLREESRENPQ